MQSSTESWLGRGGRRPVGVEIEFGGLDAMQAAAAVCRRFGGIVRPDGPHRVTAEATELGDFKVALDWHWLHEGGDSDGLVGKAKSVLGDIGAELVPMEIATPPVPAGRLPEIDALVGDLVRRGAEGTRASVFYGFGLHLNPALGPADLTADPIRRVLQAYLLAAPQLRAAIAVDPVRSLLPFVEPFPPGYADLVLHPRYAPPLDGLIDDYLRYNPTRNRELDMLPLFAELDPDRVARTLDDPLISARPTFHWRLPNADLDDPAWSVLRQWQRWLAIETAALDTDTLHDRLAERARERARGTSLWTDTP